MTVGAIDKPMAELEGADMAGLPAICKRRPVDLIAKAALRTRLRDEVLAQARVVYAA